MVKYAFIIAFTPFIKFTVCAYIFIGFFTFQIKDTKLTSFLIDNVEANYFDKANF